MTSNSIISSLTATPPSPCDTSDAHAHVAHPSTSQISYMSTSENTKHLNEEKYHADLYSMFMHDEPLTDRDALYPTTNQHSLLPTSFLPASNIDSVNSASFGQASIRSIQYV